MVTLREFKAGLPPYRALLGFDYGSKRLGAAVSDLLLMTATPYKIISRSNMAADLAEIKKLIAEKFAAADERRRGRNGTGSA